MLSPVESKGLEQAIEARLHQAVRTNGCPHTIFAEITDSDALTKAVHMAVEAQTWAMLELSQQVAQGFVSECEVTPRTQEILEHGAIMVAAYALAYGALDALNSSDRQADGIPDEWMPEDDEGCRQALVMEARGVELESVDSAPVTDDDGEWFMS